jgi:hypothetical protein
MPGPYRLPHDVRDRLQAALSPYRNREAAFALAVFLGRFWSAPGKLASAFSIDRRELAEHAALDLTEARVRGAIRVLEEVGFLDRAVVSGRTHRLTDAGELHRKASFFQFASDYSSLFDAANKRSRKAKERLRRVEAGRVPNSPQRQPAARYGALNAISPKSKERSGEQVYLGDLRSRAPSPFVPKTPLDHALDRWRRVFEERAQAGA